MNHDLWLAKNFESPQLYAGVVPEQNQDPEEKTRAGAIHDWIMLKNKKIWIVVMPPNVDRGLYQREIVGLLHFLVAQPLENAIFKPFLKLKLNLKFHPIMLIFEICTASIPHNIPRKFQLDWSR